MITYCVYHITLRLYFLITTLFCTYLLLCCVFSSLPGPYYIYIFIYTIFAQKWAAVLHHQLTKIVVILLRMMSRIIATIQRSTGDLHRSRTTLPNRLHHQSTTSAIMIILLPQQPPTMIRTLANNPTLTVISLNNRFPTASSILLR